MSPSVESTSDLKVYDRLERNATANIVQSSAIDLRNTAGSSEVE